jgi:hypothetical protein
MAATLILSDDKVRDTARDWIRRAPEGSVLTFTRPDEKKRTPPQNRLMWSLLGQLAEKARYHGYKLDKEDWKLIMLSGLRKELRIVPSLNNDGVVSLDRSSSRLTVAEMGDMVTLIEAWAGENQVTLSRTLPGYDEDA